MKLNLGSGIDLRIPGFLNVDIREDPNVDIVADIRKLDMIKSGSVDVIYASHVLEHFTRDEASEVLKEWNRILKLNGTLHVSVPDWDKIVKVYLNDEMLTEFLLTLIYGGQESHYMYHKNTFTYATLSTYLFKAGFRHFKQVERFPYDISDCTDLVTVGKRIPISLNITAQK